ncbi:MAG TPA: hypothetical protein VF978_00255 [Gemmatimonadales bacterium]
MTKQRLIMPVLALAAAAACDRSASPVAPTVAPSFAVAQLADGGIAVTGGGQFEHPTLGTVTFSVNGTQDADGRAQGRFQQHWRFADVTFKGDVTCLAVDPVNRRVWVGGVLTHSNDPDPNPIFQAGADAWFRAVDLGEGQTEADRITFLGFEGSAGIITSEEYCQVRLWADNNDRTWPISGNLTIRG